MPDLGPLVRGAVEDALTRVHVSVPGVVDAYDAATQTCSVTPMAHLRFGSQEIKLPKLDDVPVCPMRGGGFVVHLPIKAGDVVDIRFSDRILDGWRAGQNVAPTDPRNHALADAFVVAQGVWPSAQASAQTSPTDLVIAVDAPGGGCLAIKPDGTVVLGDVVGGVAATTLTKDPLLQAALVALKPILAAMVTASGSIAAASSAAAVPATALASATAATAATTAAQAVLNGLLAAWPPTTTTTKVKGL